MTLQLIIGKLYG
ncbi:hypothetical protein CGLO_13977 [Colletotrichum gloeosporioides Cg-14]|uniref:Uncharacterized protein n=1 Tax=Colletotrichum gloeosporioides (strain Cg-14) TaxID=1237896 RepID=T0K4V8_COLGC|nr:hypothetical protein CGLO_13977 [Colletotrichum gloeosporioides Cg-14]